MKKLLILTGVLSLGAMAQAAVVPAGTKLSENRTYTYWLLDAIKTLDPQKVAAVEDADATRSLVEGLYTDDSDGNLVPAGALSYKVSRDRMTYTFRLRPEAKWSNGDPVVAQDYVYAWRRLADPATASEYAYYAEMMGVVNAADVVAGKKPVTALGIRAINPHTLEVRLDKPVPYFVKMLTHTSTFPVHRKTIEKFGDDWTRVGHFVGNGAYRLVAHKVGEKIELAKSDSYWDAGRTVMTKVIGLTINDINAAYARWQAGELDRVNIPAGQYPAARKKYGNQAVSVPYACTYAYVVNLSAKGNPALQDVRVRKALSYVIDRKLIVDRVLKGGQIPAYGWTPPAINGFIAPKLDYARLTQAERDKKARALLAQAGYGPGKPLRFSLNYNTSEEHQKIAIVIRQMWKQKLGVQVTLNNFEWKVHSDKLHNQDFEMARYAWCGDYNEASSFLDLYTTASTNNDAKYSNAAYDKLMADSKSMQDPSANYEAAEARLDADVPILPIYHYAHVYMIRSDIRGLPMHNVLEHWYAKDLYRVKMLQ